MADRPTAGADRPNLDLLRSIAVLYVVAFHVLLVTGASAPGAPGLKGALNNLGHFGVLVFFVHTSFVLMLSLERDHRRDPHAPFAVPFFIRRAFRILPASIVIVMIVAAWKLPVGHFVDGAFVVVPPTAATTAANVALVQNLTGNDSLMATLWSLPYEMDMYLVLAALYWLARRVTRPELALAAWFVATLAIRFARGRWDASGLEMPAYVPCFLAGVLAYVLSMRTRRFALPWPVWPLAIAALTVPYLAHPSLDVSWLVCLALAVLVPFVRELPHGRASKVFVLIARYSYGIYLTHFIALWVGYGVVGGAVGWAVFAVIAIVAPVVLYHGIEKPLIGFGRRLTT